MGRQLAKLRPRSTSCQIRTIPRIPQASRFRKPPRNVNPALFQNYLTTLFGILAGLPILVAGSGLPMTPKWTHILLIVSGLGTVGLGVVAKAFNTHSTTAQVQTSSLQNPAIQAAAVLEAKAEAIRSEEHTSEIQSLRH